MWSGAFEEKESCRSCKNENAWDFTSQCCQKQCHEKLNALQAFPNAAWGDISAAPLDPAEVTAARKLEIQYAEKKPAWKKILRSLAKAKGWKIVTPRWIDINNGDDKNPNYRSRMVGTEFNDSVVDGLFAATPSLEALRLLLSWAATLPTDSSVSGAWGKGSGKGILMADVSRAFFEAPAKRDLCVELPEEALQGEETTLNTVGKLLASLYEARGASTNWQEEVIRCMREWGG